MTLQTKCPIWIAGGAITFLLLSLIAIPVSDDRISGPLTKAWQRERQIELMCELYALDHNGRTPNSLSELVPYNTGDTERLFDGIIFLAPNAVMKDLPPKSILLRQAHPDKDGRIAAVTADGTCITIK